MISVVPSSNWFRLESHLQVSESVLVKDMGEEVLIICISLEHCVILVKFAFFFLCNFHFFLFGCCSFFWLWCIEVSVEVSVEVIIIGVCLGIALFFDFLLLSCCRLLRLCQFDYLGECFSLVWSLLFAWCRPTWVSWFSLGRACCISSSELLWRLSGVSHWGQLRNWLSHSVWTGCWGGWRLG